MKHSTLILISGILFTAFSVTFADAATKVATTQPTLSTLAPGESVFFDDKRCPAGMIAKFTKAEKRSQMKRTCMRQ